MKRIIVLVCYVMSSVVHASWVKDAICHMSLEHKVAQLIYPGVRINNSNDVAHKLHLIQQYQFGGILLINDPSRTRCTPLEQIEIVKQLQAAASIPLLITQDCEWGLAMRLRDVVEYPRNASIAHHDDDTLYEFGKEIGRQCACVGVHVNFAPVVDVNCNPHNPIINTRSFGDTPQLVIKKAVPVMRGMQDAGIITCAKHFPGHGDTDVDSHQQLPRINHEIERLRSVELPPFQAMIDAGVDMIMVGHLLVAALDDALPASLSYAITTQLLRNELGFKGVICTDGLDMKAVSMRYSSGQLAIMAFQAGNDILLHLPDPVEGLRALVDAVKAGVIDECEIDVRVERLLCMKQQCGLHEYDHEYCVDAQLNTEYAFELRNRLYA